jgi:hypothetical protein
MFQDISFGTGLAQFSADLTLRARTQWIKSLRTGQTFQCSASTAWWGVGGGIATRIGANIQVQRCAEQMEALGYTRADNVAEKTQKDLMAVQEGARKQLEQLQQMFPAGSFCRTGVISWADNTVVRIEPNAIWAGIRQETGYLQ